jgi:aspartyl/glutamyl-tRNA(Asn/Gln) amidotransferase C subunit
MSLTQDQIKKLLKNLSKLSVDNEEVLTNKVNSIVWYMDLLNEVDTTWVEPTISVSKKENILREDIEKKEFSRKEMLGCSNQKVIWDQIAISSIMK